VLQSLRAHVVTAHGVGEGERRVVLHRPKPINVDRFCTVVVALARS
jgi:hypothetical protein